MNTVVMRSLAHQPLEKYVYCNNNIHFFHFISGAKVLFLTIKVYFRMRNSGIFPHIRTINEVKQQQICKTTI